MIIAIPLISDSWENMHIFDRRIWWGGFFFRKYSNSDKDIASNTDIAEIQIIQIWELTFNSEFELCVINAKLGFGAIKSWSIVSLEIGAMCN